MKAWLIKHTGNFDIWDLELEDGTVVCHSNRVTCREYAAREGITIIADRVAP